mgnify:CR=1 FL=1
MHYFIAPGVATKKGHRRCGWTQTQYRLKRVSVRGFISGSIKLLQIRRGTAKLGLQRRGQRSHLVQRGLTLAGLLEHTHNILFPALRERRLRDQRRDFIGAHRAAAFIFDTEA